MFDYFGEESQEMPVLHLLTEDSGLSAMVEAALALHQKVLPPGACVGQSPFARPLSGLSDCVVLHPRPWIHPWINEKLTGRIVSPGIEAVYMNRFMRQGQPRTSSLRWADRDEGAGALKLVELTDFDEGTCKDVLREWETDILVIRADSLGKLAQRVDLVRQVVRETQNVGAQWGLTDFCYTFNMSPPWLIDEESGTVVASGNGASGGTGCGSRSASKLNMSSLLSGQSIEQVSRQISLASGAGCVASVVACSMSDLANKLDVLSQLLNPGDCHRLDYAGTTHPGIYLRVGPKLTGKTALLFPGLGAAYPGMLAELCMHFPEVREVFDFVDRLAIAAGESELPCRQVFPLTNKASDGATALAHSSSAVVTVLMAEWALFTVLKNLGINHDTIMGCSTGEFAALATNGSVDIVTVAELFYRLSSEVASAIPEDAALDLRSITVFSCYDAIEPLLAETEVPVYLSAELGPRQCILSGSKEAMESIQSTLRSKNIEFQSLPLAIPYHTPLVENALRLDRKELDAYPLSIPKTRSWSCSLAAPYPTDVSQIRRLVTDLFKRPVRLKNTIESMYADGVRVFIEVGPGGGLTNLVKEILRDRTHVACASNFSSRSAISQLHHLTALMACHQDALDLGYLYRRRRPQIVDLLSSRGALHTPGETQSIVANIEAPVAAQIGSVTISSRHHDSQSYEITASQGRAEMMQTESSNSSADPRVILAFLSNTKHFHSRLLQLQEKLMTSYLGSVNDGVTESSTTLSDPRYSGATSDLGPPGSFPLRAPVELSMQGEASTAHSQLVNHVEEDVLLTREIGLPFLLGTSVKRSGAQAGQVMVIRTFDPAVDLYLLDHAIGGAVATVDGKSERVFLVPLMVTLELMAEAASLALPGNGAGLKPVYLRNVRAFRRLRVGYDKYSVRVTATPVKEDPYTIKVFLDDADPSLPSNKVKDEYLLAACDIEFSSEYPNVPVFELIQPSEGRAARITGESLYGPDTMFHGARMQAVTELKLTGREGTVGVIRTGSPEGWFAGNVLSARQGSMIMHPLLLDNASQLVLYHLFEHGMAVTALLPFYIESIELFRDLNVLPAEVIAQAKMRSITDEMTLAAVEVCDEETRLALRITGIRSRRIGLTHSLAEFVRDPLSIVLSDQFVQAEAMLYAPRHCLLTRFEFLPILADTTLADWLADYVLTASERRYYRRSIKSPARRLEWLAGRIAAKDAVRLLLRQSHGMNLRPANIEVATDSRGRPFAGGPWEALLGSSLAVSIAHKNGLAVALAGLPDSGGTVGIDMERIESRPSEFEDMALGGREMQLLEANVAASHAQIAREEKVTRIWCSKEAYGKAVGSGLNGDPRSLEVVDADWGTGRLTVCSADLSSDDPESGRQSPRTSVYTARVDEMILACVFAGPHILQD